MRGKSRIVNNQKKGGIISKKLIFALDGVVAIFFMSGRAMAAKRGLSTGVEPRSDKVGSCFTFL